MNSVQLKNNGEGAPRVLILGGGFAGLWAGYRLQEMGFQVEVLEKGEAPGGLLRTLEKNGFLFDIGPHIFLPSHLPHFSGLVGDDMRCIRGFYGFGFRGKQIRSPINPPNLLRTLGLRSTLPMALSMLFARVSAALRRQSFENVDQALTARFGERINQYFFRDYIRKVTGLPAAGVSPDWFTERHRFYQEHNLRDSVRKGMAALGGVLRTSGREEEGLTLYYPRLGAQMISDALVEKIRQRGGTVRVKAEVLSVHLDDRRVPEVTYRSEERVRRTTGSWVVSTIPVTDLVRLITPRAPAEVLASAGSLSYRHLGLFFLILRRARLSEKIQIYFPEGRFKFKRIYEPKNLDASMGTSDRTGVCAEVCFNGEDEPFGRILDPLYGMVLEGLEDFYGVAAPEVEAAAALDVPHAYAVYQKGYLSHLRTLAQYLFQHDALISYGRQGSFRYNHLVDRVIDASECMLSFIRSGQGKQEFLKQADPKSDFF